MKKKRRREKANVSAGEAGKYLDTVATNECSSENVCMVVTQMDSIAMATGEHIIIVLA